MNPIFTLRRVAFGALLCSGLAVASAFVTSEDGSVPTRVTVQYGDLDLNRPAAAEVLYRRITSAARRACGEPGRANLAQISQYKRCYAVAVADAVAKVDANTLTALHRAKTQRSTPS